MVIEYIYNHYPDQFYNLAINRLHQIRAMTEERIRRLNKSPYLFYIFFLIMLKHYYTYKYGTLMLK